MLIALCWRTEFFHAFPTKMIATTTFHMIAAFIFLDSLVALRTFFNPHFCKLFFFINILSAFFSFVWYLLTISTIRFLALPTWKTLVLVNLWSLNHPTTIWTITIKIFVAAFDVLFDQKLTNVTENLFFYNFLHIIHRHSFPTVV